MRIGIVCYPTFGGSGVVATELGIALAGKGHEIHFITYKQPVRLSLLGSNIHFHEVHVPEYPLFRGWANIERFDQLRRAAQDKERSLGVVAR